MSDRAVSVKHGHRARHLQLLEIALAGIPDLGKSADAYVAFDSYRTALEADNSGVALGARTVLYDQLEGMALPPDTMKAMDWAMRYLDANERPEVGIGEFKRDW